MVYTLQCQCHRLTNFVQSLLFACNIRLYVQVSDNVMEIMKGFAENFQQYSIDEAFLVPRPDIKSFEEAALCALRIKDEIKRQERITCSVGVGPNKLIAKIASKFRKPDGLTVVRPECSRVHLSFEYLKNSWNR